MPYLYEASSIGIIPNRHEVSSTESTESRRRRKLKLQQRSTVRKGFSSLESSLLCKFHWSVYGVTNPLFGNAVLLPGIPNIPDASLSCGHFDPLFLAALKGTSYYLYLPLGNHIHSIALCCALLFHCSYDVASIMQHHILADPIMDHLILPVLIAMLSSGMPRE